MGNLNEQVRPYTMKEVRSEFLTTLYVTQEILDKQGKRDGFAIAHSVLDMIDQGQPLFEIIESTDNKDIAGVLHSLIMETDERLNSREKIGQITSLQKAFVNSIRLMAFMYNKNNMTDSHVLTAGILKLIDKGISGVNFQLKALGTEDDIEYFKSIGANYYPLEGENIAGDLVNEYQRIVEACRSKKSELENMLAVIPEETQPQKQM